MTFCLRKTVQITFFLYFYEKLNIYKNFEYLPRFKKILFFEPVECQDVITQI